MVLGRLSWPVEGSAAAAATDADGPLDTPPDDMDDHDDGAAALPGGRFCLCVGDDVSDEDMFIAAKVRHETQSWEGQRLRLVFRRRGEGGRGLMATTAG